MARLKNNMGATATRVKCLPGERWKYIPKSRGMMISSLGRLYNSWTGNLWKEVYNMCGSSRVVFREIGTNKKRSTSIHYLVAEAFIPNPQGLAYVFHKDYDRKNNTVSNLMWVSKIDPLCSGKAGIGRPKNFRFKGSGSRIICQLDTGTGSVIAEYKNVKVASMITGINYSNLLYALRKGATNGGIPVKYAGFMWRHKTQ